MMFEGFDRFGQAFLAALVSGLLIGVGTLLLVIPGIILAIMWMFLYFVMAETNLEFWPAMEYSANLTAGYRWELFCLLLACSSSGILGLLACCVGIFVAAAGDLHGDRTGVPVPAGAPGGTGGVSEAPPRLLDPFARR